MVVLGIETSCDECSVSVVRYRSEFEIEVLSLATFSQIELHRPFGGVVPEVASRNHLESMIPMLKQAVAESGVALDSVDAIAVTYRPGLIGALLVGVSTAKSLGYALGKPVVAVHHLEGHAVSPFLVERGTPPGNGVKPEFPLLIATVSGGHTNLYLSETSPLHWREDFLKKSLVARSRDDAAGEAFDKTAKMLGFPYPGGVWIDETAKKGNKDAFSFPRGLRAKEETDFSFSGLKTAFSLKVQQLEKAGRLEENIPDLCASIQEAIVDTLFSKIATQVSLLRCKSLALVGGVSANSRMRAKLTAEWRELGLSSPPLYPKLAYCTDNAAMIAASGAYRLLQGHAVTGEALLRLTALADPGH